MSHACPTLLYISHACPPALANRQRPIAAQGVVSVDVYRRSKSAGCESTYAKYAIKASAFTVSYFMAHHFDRVARWVAGKRDALRAADRAREL